MGKPNKRITELVQDMQDEGDLHEPAQPPLSRLRVIAITVAAIIVIYALLTAVLVTTRA